MPALCMNNNPRGSIPNKHASHQLDSLVQGVTIPLESLSLNRPQHHNSRQVANPRNQEHFGNISGINGASGTQAHEKENDCLYADEDEADHSKLRKSCLVKLGKKAMRKVRDS